ncbi:MAG: helix-turn-helix transcriptional regulator [Saprospirales bacterium]|nr:helix-turn-helix transcriptional regulator [Saprospirales bacterium]MBK8921300.1 helix-turn-helix transcriptional regulator [Saprospirales bacterium]
MAKTQQQRMVLGLKVRQFRQERNWNFEELSKHTGISVSYLNEIEKGKKYPQPENLKKLADAFGVGSEFLASTELSKHFAPLGDLLESNFLQELPLDFFGIELQQVVEIIARAPDRVNAFISALLEIARNYSLRNENFYFAALRAYQELHMNYLEDIERVADTFVQRHRLPENGGVPAQFLADLLVAEYHYRIDEKGLDEHPELQSMRAVFNPRKRLLLLNRRLNERQRAFQLAKELGFNVLQLKVRPLASALLRINSFEEVLNNYKAAYFAVALLVNRNAFVRDLQTFFQQSAWSEPYLFQLMAKYQASPEVLFQRFNVLSLDFDLQKVFFLRFIHDLERDKFDIDKELHLNRRHQPHASGLDEHYCRRWLSISLLRDLQNYQRQSGDHTRPLAGVQRALFADSQEEYICFAVAKPGFPTLDRNVSVTLGILLDEQARQVIRFWDDPSIPRHTVNVTCERCAISGCRERAVPAAALEKREERRKMQEALKKLTG